MVYNNEIPFRLPKKETELIEDCDIIFKLRRAVQPRANQKIFAQNFTEENSSNFEQQGDNEQ